MNTGKGPYWEDIERNRIFTIALLYEKAADELTPWDAKCAEECYQKKIELLTPLAPVSYGLAATLQKLANVQIKQGKQKEAASTMRKYEEMCSQLDIIKIQTLTEYPELLDMSDLRIKYFGGFNLDKKQEDHEWELLKKYKIALNGNRYLYDFYPQICDFFKKRGICLCVNNPVGEILLTGINPSYPYKAEERGDGYTLYTFLTAHDPNGYWQQKRDMVGNLASKTAYLDLFPLKFCHQDGFEELMEQNRELRAAIVSITQMEIETHIRPKLIIVANQQSSYYWGRNPKSTWMGYDGLEDKDVFSKEMLPKALQDKNITLCQIRGFKDKDDRLNKKEFTTTALAGSLVLFYGMYTNRHKANPNMENKILNVEQFRILYEFAKQKKEEWKETHK